MTKRAYLEVGAKLLGLYIGVLGLAGLAGAVSAFPLGWSGKLTAFFAASLFFSKILAFLRPAIYLGLAFALTRKTAGIVRWCTPDEKDTWADA